MGPSVKGLALGSAAATLIALAVGVAVLASGGDGDSPAALDLRAASPTATTTLPSATSEKTSTPAPAPGPTATPVAGGSDAILAGAGDIADSGPGAEATAKLLDVIPGTVATFGDNAYNSGKDSEFANYYNPSWGRHKSRTRPAAGNHDYGTPGAAGYYKYFGAAAGDPSEGYYSYNLGAWHVVVLNSNCAKITGGCGSGSGQEQWLRTDLAAHPTKCTLAYWHHPRYSSGTEHGNATFMRDIYKALYDLGADVVFSGHEHNYERFAPQDADGNLDTARGIRQFVVGTGGAHHYGFVSTPVPHSEVRNSDTYGVIQLTLHSGSYDWKFLPEAGKTFTDSGSQGCH